VCSFCCVEAVDESRYGFHVYTPLSGQCQAGFAVPGRPPLAQVARSTGDARGEGGARHSRQDKMEIIEDEGILHEVNNFPCCLQEKYPCSCP